MHLKQKRKIKHKKGKQKKKKPGRKPGPKKPKIKRKNRLGSFSKPGQDPARYLRWTVPFCDRIWAGCHFTEKFVTGAISAEYERTPPPPFFLRCLHHNAPKIGTRPRPMKLPLFARPAQLPRLLD